MVSIGKLHFRGLPGDDHGFSEELLPMHVVDGIGDVKGLVRQDIPRRNGYDKLARLAGPGESPYTRYDRDIAARAQAWLREEAPRRRGRLAPRREADPGCGRFWLHRRSGLGPGGIYLRKRRSPKQDLSCFS